MVSTIPSALLGKTGRSHLRVLRTSAVGGGSINRCLQVETNEGSFFVKENSAEDFPAMFEAEARGLELLAKTNTFAVPHAYGCTTEKGRAYLLLEWMERADPGKSGWWDAGVLLAKLHRQTAESFGLEHDNYIGTLPQSNRQHATWEDFFTLERILPLIRMARDAERTDAALSKKAEQFCKRIPELFPPEKPALLHGDLWSGNFFFSSRGPTIVDPAVYYGRPEMDLAMTRLFGGFNDDFYAGYENEFTLQKNWRQLVDYCNLYPLLVHVNLFGGGYLQDVKRILSKF